MGNEDKWLMVARNSGSFTVGDSNAVSYVSNNPLSFGSAATDAGILLRNNPPQLFYEWGKVWLITFSRRNRKVVNDLTNNIVIASAPARALYANGGNFGALRSGWSDLTSVPDWASGYIHVFRKRGKWSGTFVSGEQGISGVGQKTNLLLEIGNFSPPTAGATDILRMAPRANLFDNGGFQVSQRGDTYAVSGAWATYVDRWGASTPANESMSLRRLPMELGQIDVREVTHFIRLLGTSAGNTHLFGQRMGLIRDLGGRRVSLSFWARCPGGTITNPQINFYQNFGNGGSASAVVSATPVTDVVVSGVWRLYEYSFTIPSIKDKIFGTNNNDYFWLVWRIPLGTNRALDIAAPKLEICGICTPFVMQPYADELTKALRYYCQTYSDGVLAGTVGVAGFLQDRARGTEAQDSVNFSYRFSLPMAGVPTVALFSPTTGASGQLSNVTSSTDLAARVVAIGNTGVVLGNNASTTANSTYRVHITAYWEH